MMTDLATLKVCHQFFAFDIELELDKTVAVPCAPTRAHPMPATKIFREDDPVREPFSGIGIPNTRERLHINPAQEPMHVPHPRPALMLTPIRRSCR